MERRLAGSSLQRLEPTVRFAHVFYSGLCRERHGTTEEFRSKELRLSRFQELMQDLFGFMLLGPRLES